MKEYIMKQLAGMQQNANNDASDEIAENAAIMECSHLIAELDDLTVEGTELNKFRDIDAVNIPIDDDGVIDTLEVCVANGSIVDIPADVLVHSESYEYMKSKEDFIQETVDANPRRFLEEDDEYNTRIQEALDVRYEAYMDQIFQEGLFGASKVHLGDPSIRWYVQADFGPSDPSDPSSQHFTMKVPVGYIPANGRDKVLVKQRDSIAVLADGHPEIFADAAKMIYDQMMQTGGPLPKGTGFFDVAVPKMLIVPVDPMDKFCVVIEFENVMSKDKKDDFLYVTFTIPIKSKKNVNSTDLGITAPAGIKPVMATPNRVTLNSLVDKTSFLKECYREKTPIGRVVQEAINFSGSDGGDANPPAPTDTPAAVDDTATIDGGGDASAAPVDGGATDTGNTDNTNAVNIPTNDVSNAIAGAVADDIDKQQNPPDGTNPEGDATSLDAPATDIPDDQGTVDDIDAGNIDAVNPESVDDQLADLNDEGETTMDDTTTGSIADISSMSPDAIKSAVVDKVNKMPLSDIQAFLNNDDAEDASSSVDGEGITEAFVLTKKNINAELDVTLRKALGDLNDSKSDLDSIVSSFKKDGKKLNRALSKASKMTDVYSETETKQFIKLNKCVADLVVALNPNIDKKAVAIVKRLIKAFTSQAVVVGNIIDKHKGDADKSPKRVVD